MLSKSHNSDPFTEFAALYPYIRCTQIEARLLALRLPSQRFTDRTMASGHTMTHLVAPMHASTLGRCISVLHGCHTAMGGVIRCCGRTAKGNPMNKTERSARVAPRTPVSGSGVDAAVGTLFSASADALAAPETVTIAGCGTFSTTSRSTPQDLNPERARASAPVPRPSRRSRPTRPYATLSTGWYQTRTIMRHDKVEHRHD